MPRPSSRFHSDSRMDTGASLLDRTGSVVLEGVACPMGCPRGDEAVLTGHDRLHGLPGRFTVVRCNTCKLTRTTPRPDAATMGNYYPADYQPYSQTRIKDKAPRSDDHTSELQSLLRYSYAVFCLKTKNTTI